MTSDLEELYFISAASHSAAKVLFNQFQYVSQNAKICKMVVFVYIKGLDLPEIKYLKSDFSFYSEAQGK